MPEMTVVLVEDSLTIRRQIVQRLRGVEGLRIVGEAADEATAVAVVELTRPDVVLLDLSLADGGSGLTVLKQLRKRGYTGQAYVLSHQTPDAYRAACVAAGANGFFDKADELDLLLRTMYGGQEPAVPAPLAEARFVERLEQSARLALREGGDISLHVLRGEAADLLALAESLAVTGDPGDLVGHWPEAGRSLLAIAIPEETESDDLNLRAKAVPAAADARWTTLRFPADALSAEALLALARLRLPG